MSQSPPNPNPPRKSRPPRKKSLPSSAQENIDQTLHDRKNGRSSNGTQTVTIAIAGVKSRGEDVQQYGICIREEYNLTFMRYPAQLSDQHVLPHVLETAISRAPAMSDLVLTTPFKQLWDERQYTDTTLATLREHRSTLRHAYPLQGDLGNTLARLAARGVTGPAATDYHLYTATICDTANSYIAAILWGRGKAWRLVQTIPGHDLLTAEGKAIEAALHQIPPDTSVQIHNANEYMMRLWDDPGKRLSEDSALKEAITGTVKLVRKKQLRLPKERDEWVTALVQGARQLAADNYATLDLRRRKKGKQ